MIGRSIVAQLVYDILPTEWRAEKSPTDIEQLLETPKDTARGEIAFPCFQLAKAFRKAPPVVAGELAEQLAGKIDSTPEISHVVAEGPYINFFLDKAILANTLVEDILRGNYLRDRPHRNERVMVEYGSVNTHKAFHVGHIRNVALGDSIARLFAWSGATTIRAAYLGDEGTHIAKCLWFLKTHPNLTIPAENRLEFLGKLYTDATLKLDLESYTRAPFPGVVTARVRSIAPHPTDSTWLLVSLDSRDGEQVVITQQKNGAHLQPGNLVPHVPPGTQFGAKQIGLIDKKGVTSHGLMLGPKELELGESDQVMVLSLTDDVRRRFANEVGIEIVEVFRIPGTLPESELILSVVREWNREVSEILRRLENGDPELRTLWEETREWSLDEIKQIFTWLNSPFDEYFFESECGEPSKAIVEEYRTKGVFIESDGAVGADLRPYKLGFCVLIKRDGTALYATRDLALARRKFDFFHIDRSIYVVDAAQTLHFQQVFKCLELMGYDQVAKCFHCAYAQVVLPDGKMSSRKGNIVLMSALRERLLAKIHSEYLDKYRGAWTDSEIETAAHKIALATIRYGMLNQDNNSLIVFDLEAWTSRSGNTGPYMMYAYARTRSILRELNQSESNLKVNGSLLQHETEIEVLRHLNEYHSTLEHAIERYSPHLVCIYVYELAKRFSRMYQQCSVLQAETPALRTSRAALVAASGNVIRHALGVLGIDTVERM